MLFPSERKRLEMLEWRAAADMPFGYREQVEMTGLKALEQVRLRNLWFATVMLGATHICLWVVAFGMHDVIEQTRMWGLLTAIISGFALILAFEENHPC